MYRAHSEQSQLFLAPQRPHWKRYATCSRKIPPAAPDPSGGQCAPGNSNVLDLKGQKVQAGLAPALITVCASIYRPTIRLSSFLTAGVCACATVPRLWLDSRMPTLRYYYTLHQAQQHLRCHHCDSQARCRASALPAVPHTWYPWGWHRTA